ncbi:Uncharacterised protein [Mycobacterium tuberculosis]|uniref:Uncharacterized protein n=1 Tax=Mycobacterium tuberculosis TaxID=1773 RepID=A0A0U0SX50_MYCTX|nr:Uncharacterised protein [Mycobacterium tuberculosis]COY92640.1 Uncharacterised protein [Mycobacterium tuberculosis]COZ65448.1 Uncharacterised protein [Mycobacterium tuberculosis]
MNAISLLAFASFYRVPSSGLPNAVERDWLRVKTSRGSSLGFGPVHRWGSSASDGFVPWRTSTNSLSITRTFAAPADEGPEASRPKWMLPYGEMFGAAATS